MKEKKCDLFISYAHEDDKIGWVEEFVKKLDEEYERIVGRNLEISEVFYDKKSIKNGEDWQARIAESVASAKQFIMFISPAYFRSEWCRREWRKWIDTEIANSLLNQGACPFLIVPVEGFLDSKGWPPEQVARTLIEQAKKPLTGYPLRTITKHIRELMQRHHDGKKYIIPPSFKNPLEALQKGALQETLKELASQLDERQLLSMKAAESESTIPCYNRNFTGRLEELIALNAHLRSGPESVVFSIKGMGGIGKSELAFTYAHAYAHAYLGGRYYIACDGHRSLKEALVSQVSRPGQNCVFGQFSKELREDPEECFNQFCNTIIGQLGKGNVLFLLDNVTNLKLLKKKETDLLASLGKGVHILATTRLQPKQPISKIQHLALESLSIEDSIELLRKFHYFNDDTEEGKAACQIAEYLDGFTLAVELVGAYVANNPTESYRYRSKQMGIAELDSLGESEEDLLHRTEHHAQEDRNWQRLSSVMEFMFEGLSPEGRRTVEYAALLPPDHIALPWLKILLFKDFPFLKQQEEEGLDVWAGILDELLRLSIFTVQEKEGQPNKLLARMHRLVQDWIKIQKTQENPSLEALYLLLQDRAEALTKEIIWREFDWELEVLIEFIKLNLPQIPYELIRAGLHLKDTVAYNLGNGRAKQLLDVLHSPILQRYEANPKEDNIRDLAFWQKKWGEITEVFEGSATAKRFYEKGIGLMKQLYDKRPDPQNTWNLLSLYERLIEALETLGDTAKVSLLYRKYAKLGMKWIDSELGLEDTDASALPDRNSSLITYRIGRLFDHLEDPAQARINYERFCRDIQQFYQENPNAQNTRDLALAYERLGNCSQALDGPAAAKPLFQRSMELTRHLYRKEPSPRNMRELALSFDRLGRIEEELKDIAAAKAFYMKSLESTRHLYEEEPSA